MDPQWEGLSLNQHNLCQKVGTLWDGEGGKPTDEWAEEGCLWGFGMKPCTRYVNPSSESLGKPSGNMSGRGNEVRAFW